METFIPSDIHGLKGGRLLLHIQKKIRYLGVHVIFKSDKLDYLQGPRKEKKITFFSIGQGPINPWKFSWNLLVFFYS